MQFNTLTLPEIHEPDNNKSCQIWKEFYKQSINAGCGSYKDSMFCMRGRMIKFVLSVRLGRGRFSIGRNGVKTRFENHHRA